MVSQSTLYKEFMKEDVSSLRTSKTNGGEANSDSRRHLTLEVLKGEEICPTGHVPKLLRLEGQASSGGGIRCHGREQVVSLPTVYGSDI